MRWLPRRGRHERVAARAERGERAWRRDLQQHPDELLAFRDAQIDGLRETNEALRRRLADLEAQCARLQSAHARTVMTGLTRRWMQDEVQRREQHAAEPTEVTPPVRFSGPHTQQRQRGGPGDVVLRRTA